MPLALLLLSAVALPAGAAPQHFATFECPPLVVASADVVCATTNYDRSTAQVAFVLRDINGTEVQHCTNGIAFGHTAFCVKSGLTATFVSCSAQIPAASSTNVRVSMGVFPTGATGPSLECRK